MPVAARAMDVHRWYDVILKHVAVRSERQKERPIVALVRSAARSDDTVGGEGLRCVTPFGDRNVPRCRRECNLPFNFGNAHSDKKSPKSRDGILPAVDIVEPRRQMTIYVSRWV